MIDVLRTLSQVRQKALIIGVGANPEPNDDVSIDDAYGPIIAVDAH